MSISERLHELDRAQQRRRRTSFVVAVVKKFSDDQAGQLAALIAYYAFVSLFPLLLVMVTVLGFVLQNNPSERETIINGALGQIPVIGDPLKRSSLTGSTPALIIGLVGALSAGVGITNATQNAFNRIWGVPRSERPNFIVSRVRGLAMLLLLGSMSIISTLAAGYVGSSSHGAAAVAGGILLALLFNFALFMSAFKLLTARELTFANLVPGVLVASVLWQLLQIVGGLYIDHVLKRTQALYGFFAVVLGLLAWLYLGAQLTILAAEVNVVRVKRLWPRSFLSDPLLDADRRALTSAAEAEQLVSQQDVRVSFDED